MSEFERGCLEAKVSARRAGQDEAKVDVDDSASRVQEDVTIVSETMAIISSLATEITSTWEVPYSPLLHCINK